MTATVNARWRLGDVPVDRVTFDQALEAISQMIRSGAGGAVYTPNADHVVMAREHEGLRRAYQEVDLSVADGMPLVWASRLLGAPVPEKISGSDLVPRLMGRAEREGWRVYLLGGGPGVATRAAENLRVTHPRLSVVGTASPRIEATDGPSAHAALMAGVREVSPDVVLVGLGAPKQELFIHQVRHALRPAVLLGVGATLDFMAGIVPRAPRWVSSAGLEWAYRLAHEPRRLWRRYLVRDPRFVGIVVRDLVRA